MSCKDPAASKTEQRAAALFNQLWPENLSFPPFAPYLGASVERQRILPVFVRFAGTVLPESGTWDYSRIAEFVAFLVTSSSRSIRRARQGAMREESKKSDPPTFDPPDLGGLPEVGDCFSASCTLSDGRTGEQTCCYQKNERGELILVCDPCHSPVYAYTDESSDPSRQGGFE